MSITRILPIALLVWILIAPGMAAEPDTEGDIVLPAADDVFDDRPRQVVDGYLEDVLAESETGDVMEIVVQFLDDATDVDIGYLERLGFEVLHEYDVIPAVWAKGPASAVTSLSRYEGVKWLEYNERLKYMMERSLSTINASKTWVSPVREETGEVLNLGTHGNGYDGTGVTVVVLDSGIDASHPDMDYGEKTIMNLKSDTGNGPWYEVENTDTSIGHGTHCAGTVAGNGDASGGARRGVAPGANLIGLGAGDALFISGALGGMEWVYEHSRPGHNTYNIRVVSNSWGSGGAEYDPSDAICAITDRVGNDNNVMVVFAAGNSGGDGTDVQSSAYGSSPIGLCVAALERDGSGVATFSSRGQSDLNHTYPDIGAPGVKIWSTAARRTYISVLTKTGDPSAVDPYYFAISGTSMATPHVSGLCAVLWQAYPGLGRSDVHEHYQEGGQLVDENWWNGTETYVHDIELILELTSSYIPANGENGVPDNDTRTGHKGRTYDFAQGYGCVQADRAVALALTLKELRTRDFDGDGLADYPEASVFDAYDQYMGTMKTEALAGDTNTLYSSWTGEWSRFNNQTGQPVPWQHDQAHMVYVPVEATQMTVELSYEAASTTENYAATLNLVLDYDMDGSVDWSQTSGRLEGHATSVIDLTQSGFSEARGNLWSFNIEGQGFQLPGYDIRKGTQFIEIRVEYEASVSMYFPMGNGTVNIDVKHMAPYVGQLMFGDPTTDYTPEQGQIIKTTFMYDMGEVTEPGKKEKTVGVEPTEPWGAVLAAILAMAVLYVANYYRKHRKLPDPGKAFSKA